MQRIEKVLLLTALLAIAGVASSRVFSFDIFWQMQSGKHMLATKGFIYRDIFSLAAEAPRFEHCWLHDVVFYLVFRGGGYAALSLLKGLLIAATSGVLVATALGRGSSFAAVLLISLPTFLATEWVWKDRPQLWSFILFALFLLILERYREAPGRFVWLLFPLMLLWANLHGGSVLAFPVVCAYLVGMAVDRRFGRTSLPGGTLKRLLFVFLSLFIAALVTPYGTEVLRTLVDAPGYGSGILHASNLDWGSLRFDNPRQSVPLGVSLILLLTARKRVSCSEILLLGGLLLMGAKLARHYPFFLFAVAALIPRYADRFLEASRRIGKRAGLIRWAALLAAASLFVLLYAPLWKREGFFDLGLEGRHYPVQAAAFLREQGLPANLFNSYSWGGYLMWELYPEYRVFWDGRQNSKEMFERGMDIQYGHGNWQDILDAYAVQTVLLKPLSETPGGRFPILDRMRESSEWALVFADGEALIYVRRDAVDRRWLELHRLPKDRADDTILSAARYLVERNPDRYKAYGEMANVYLARGDFPRALEALENYLARSPEADPAAERYYRDLKGTVSGRPR